MNHLRRINVLIKLLSRAELEVKRRFLQAHVVSMCVLGDLRSIIVAHERRKRRHEHERTGHQVMQTLFVGRDADDAVDLKRLHDVREVADRLDEVVGNNRLEDVKLDRKSVV